MKELNYKNLYKIESAVEVAHNCIEFCGRKDRFKNIVIYARATSDAKHPIMFKLFVKQYLWVADGDDFDYDSSKMHLIEEMVLGSTELSVESIEGLDKKLGEAIDGLCRKYNCAREILL